MTTKKPAAFKRFHVLAIMALLVGLLSPLSEVMAGTATSGTYSQVATDPSITGFEVGHYGNIGITGEACWDLAIDGFSTSNYCTGDTVSGQWPSFMMAGRNFTLTQTKVPADPCAGRAEGTSTFVAGMFEVFSAVNTCQVPPPISPNPPPADGTLVVQLVNQIGVPVPAACFDITLNYSIAVKTASGCTDANGQFKGTYSAPAQVSVHQTNVPTGCIAASSDVTGTLDPNTTTTLKITNACSVLNIRLTEQAQLAVPGACYTVTDALGTAQQGVCDTDKDGIVTLSNLAPGTAYIKETSGPTGCIYPDDLKLTINGVGGSAMIYAGLVSTGNLSNFCQRWKTPPGYPLIVELGNNLTGAWAKGKYLNKASDDWSKSSVLDTKIVKGGTNPKYCLPTPGRVEVCNANYGPTPWVGIANTYTVNGYIYQATVKMNDYLLTGRLANDVPIHTSILCQELGHTLGLVQHQDEITTNANLLDANGVASCMDYSNDVVPNQQPNQTDYDNLVTLYTLKPISPAVGATATSAGVTSTTTTMASISQVESFMSADPAKANPTEWGRMIKQSADGYQQVYERDFGGGYKVQTFVYLAEPHGK
jgi:hypothetical protein